MKTCSLVDFMEELKPWLDSDYIRKAYLNKNGHFVMQFLDGVKNVYQIDDCTKAQLKTILADLKKKGILVGD
jgi:hypothetical protein